MQAASRVHDQLHVTPQSDADKQRERRSPGSAPGDPFTISQPARAPQNRVDPRQPHGSVSQAAAGLSSLDSLKSTAKLADRGCLPPGAIDSRDQRDGQRSRVATSSVPGLRVSTPSRYLELCFHECPAGFHRRSHRGNCCAHAPDQLFRLPQRRHPPESAVSPGLRDIHGRLSARTTSEIEELGGFRKPFFNRSSHPEIAICTL